ncbi:hypothetical protein COF68_06350 [Bacillus toyonensis]|uniref:hypothetical protein n=1 Tax=Bacillus toyonensis TaxID=155322 RepID=UPI000BFD69A0|nr:hypothetical protein [Bacillus toyonensis]PHE64455.1 hypothetical protein COF68_06350 [Bacillus toyonensis]
MSKAKTWAEQELELNTNEGDLLQHSINRKALELLDLFNKQEHSGFTAEQTLRVFTRLAKQEPLSPLTGEEDEWQEPFEDGTQRNKRCGRVFRDNGDNATAHIIRAKLFSNDDGKTWYTNRSSSVPVTFPYEVPLEPEYIKTNYKDYDAVDVIRMKGLKCVTGEEAVECIEIGKRLYDLNLETYLWYKGDDGNLRVVISEINYEAGCYRETDETLESIKEKHWLVKG